MGFLLVLIVCVAVMIAWDVVWVSFSLFMFMRDSLCRLKSRKDRRERKRTIKSRRLFSNTFCFFFSCLHKAKSIAYKLIITETIITRTMLSTYTLIIWKSLSVFYRRSNSLMYDDQICYAYILNSGKNLNIHSLKRKKGISFWEANYYKVMPVFVVKQQWACSLFKWVTT